MKKNENYLKEGRFVDMSRKNVVVVLAVVVILGIASVAMAKDESAQAVGLWTIFGIAITSGFGLALVASVTAIAMSFAVKAALTGTARNPEAARSIMVNMIIGLALMEALCIYTLLVSFILVFKIPDLGPMMDAIVKSFGA